MAAAILNRMWIDFFAGIEPSQMKPNAAFVRPLSVFLYRKRVYGYRKVFTNISGIFTKR